MKDNLTKVVEIQIHGGEIMFQLEFMRRAFLVELCYPLLYLALVIVVNKRN